MNSKFTRFFLGWDQPALKSAADWIYHRTTSDQSELDLSRTLVLVPGNRVGRGLTGSLVDLCESKQTVLVPPRIYTPRQLAVHILQVPDRQIPVLTQRLAWINAFRMCNENERSVLTPNQYDPDQWEHWMGLAVWIQKTSDELGEAGIRFSQIPDIASTLLDEQEIARWRIFARIQDRYESELTKRGWIDPTLYMIRQIEQSSVQVSIDHDLLLFGISELGSQTKKAIELSGLNVTSLVFAPRNLEERFDELGCVRTSEWVRSPIPIDESNILFTDNPSDLCEQALTSYVQRIDDSNTTPGVFGIADESYISTLQRKIDILSDGDELHIHNPAGISAVDSAVGTLIELIIDHLEECSYQSLSRFIRHPAVENALMRINHYSTNPRSEPSGWWLTATDMAQMNHALHSIPEVPQATPSWISEDLRFVFQAIDTLLAPFNTHPKASRALDEWASSLVDTLEEVYRDVNLNLELANDLETAQTLQAMGQIQNEISQSSTIIQQLPKLQAHEAIRIVLDRLGEFYFPDKAHQPTIEAVGWLELALDPSPYTVVLGLHETCVPGSITADPCLPGSLRTALGLPTNDDRLARDSFLITSISASRDATYLCSRMGHQNDPVTPSRLLFRTRGGPLAERVQRFVRPELNSKQSYEFASSPKSGHRDQYCNPLRVSDSFSAPRSMRVTEFDTFLRSPADWYIARSLNVNELELSSHELSYMHLGTLAHSVFEEFGKNPDTKDLDCEQRIQAVLIDLLHTQSNRMFGNSPPTTLKIQTTLLERRLGYFAHHQARRRREGWRITHTEWSPSESNQPVLVVDEIPLSLRGKLDRIDTHSDGRIAVIDYKTGLVKDARKAHLHNDRWMKLQLPLYHKFVESFSTDQPVQLGYAGLPSNESESVWSFAQWSPEELSDAENEAANIVREIRAFKPGDIIRAGDHPPSNGILGFISGARFESGGLDVSYNTNQPSVGDLI